MTGTNGKSSTCLILARLFEAAGFRVGMSSGLVIKVGAKEWLNPTHMTMPGRHHLQRLLRKMADAGCQVAIVETTSEGIKQWRHLGIAYDVAVLTYLAPEHIKAHGSFENYRKEKEKMFAALSVSKRKKIKDLRLKINGNNEYIPKISVVNIDDTEAEHFLKYDADAKIGYGLRTFQIPDSRFQIQRLSIARDIHYLKDGAEFTVDEFRYRTYLLSEMYVYNALAALSVMRAFGIDHLVIQKGFESVRSIPGRLEFIENDRGITAIVDHAHTPDAYERLLSFLRQVFPHERFIAVFGSAGGGRDPGKRPLLGKCAAQYCDVVILTEEDSYETPTPDILNDIERGIDENRQQAAQLVKAVQVLKIEQRQEAIQKSVALARPGDVILLLGKGVEPVIQRKDKSIPWDDRERFRDVLARPVDK